MKSNKGSTYTNTNSQKPQAELNESQEIEDLSFVPWDFSQHKYCISE